MVRKSGQNIVPLTDLLLSSGDGLMIIAEEEFAISAAGAQLGKLEPGRIVKDRSALDYIRVFVGKANVVGIPLANLPMPTGFPSHFLHVRRYDMDIVPTPDLMLEFGDRVGVLVPPERKDEIRRHFGDREGCGGIQLRIAWHWHGARGPARPYSNSGAGRRDRNARHRRGPTDRCADRGQTAPDRPPALDDAPAGKHGAAQLRVGNLPRHRGNQTPGSRSCAQSRRPV